MTVSFGFALFILGVYLLATARVVRFINHDSLLDSVRIAVAVRARDGDRSGKERARWALLGEFAGCVWCVSIWVAGATAWVPTVIVGLPLGWWPVIALAASHLIGVAAPLSADDIEIVEG